MKNTVNITNLYIVDQKNILCLIIVKMSVGFLFFVFFADDISNERIPGDKTYHPLSPVSYKVDARF